VPVVMATNRAMGQPASSWGKRGYRSSYRSAFTLTDLLVSMAIIAVLISLMLPSISGVREATRKVVCQSNMRQVGLGAAMYADDNGGKLPPTDHSAGLLVRSGAPAVWDGLGILYNTEYCNAPPVFYCPSHRGNRPYAAFAPVWPQDSGQIFVNFQYRGPGDNVQVRADHDALLSDGLATRSDFSHNVGSNVVRVDYSVCWVPDVGGQIARALPLDDGDINAASKVSDAWQVLDQPTPRAAGN